MISGRTESSDEMLMVQYRRGDRGAFAELVRRYDRKLYNFAFRYLRSPEGARDITQETFTRVVRRAAEFRNESRFSTWIYRIARNLCVDELRKASHRSHATLDGPDEGGIPLGEKIADSSTTAERVVEGSELKQHLARAIDALPEEQREVFLLRQVGALRFDEIAVVTGTPANTVKSRMRYALERLQKDLCEFEAFARALR